MPPLNLNPVSVLNTADLLIGNPATPGLAVLPPLCPGDRLDSVLLSLVGDDNDMTTSRLWSTIEIYACNSKPATSTEARNGKAVVGSFVVPAVPFLRVADNFTASTFARIPLNHTIARDGLWIAVVCTQSTEYAASGSVAFDVFRNPNGNDDYE